MFKRIVSFIVVFTLLLSFSRIAKADYVYTGWSAANITGGNGSPTCYSWQIQGFPSANSTLPIEVNVIDGTTGTWYSAAQYGYPSGIGTGDFELIVTSPSPVTSIHIQVYQYSNGNPAIVTYWLIDKVINCSSGTLGHHKGK